VPLVQLDDVRAAMFGIPDQPLPDRVDDKIDHLQHSWPRSSRELFQVQGCLQTIIDCSHHRIRCFADRANGSPLVDCEKVFARNR
jgi:hypothetical protein